MYQNNDTREEDTFWRTMDKKKRGRGGGTWYTRDPGDGRPL